MDKVAQEIRAIRNKVDTLDRQIMKLLRERFKLVEKIGKLKVKVGLPVYQKARWEAVLRENIERGKKLKLNEDFVQSFMKLIHKESIRIQREKRDEVKK